MKISKRFWRAATSDRRRTWPSRRWDGALRFNQLIARLSDMLTASCDRMADSGAGPLPPPLGSGRKEWCCGLITPHWYVSCRESDTERRRTERGTPMARSTSSSSQRRGGRFGIVLGILALVVVLLVVGFTAGWFDFSSSETKSQFTIDQAEIREDVDQAAEVSREAVNKSAEAVQSATKDDSPEH